MNYNHRAVELNNSILGNNNNSSCTTTNTLDVCIEIANLTTGCLRLQRKIQELREDRKEEQQHHEDLKSHYEKRMEIGSTRLQSAIFFFGRNTNNLQHYTNAVKKKFYDDTNPLLPTPYVIRKYTGVVRMARSQELIDIYARNTDSHNRQLIQQMEDFITNENEELKVCKRKLDIILESLAQIVLYNVESYYNKAHNNSSSTNTMGGARNHFRNNDGIFFKRPSLQRLLSRDSMSSRGSNKVVVVHNSNMVKGVISKHKAPKNKSWRRLSNECSNDNNRISCRW